MHVCRWCGAGIGIHDEAAWDEWTTILTLNGQDAALCYSSPDHHHQPKD